MRKAAGILLMIIGALLLVGFAIPLIQYGIVLLDSVFEIFFMICGAFLITGGGFCLKKKYWRLCLASAWLAISIIITGFMWFMSMWLTGHFQLPLQDSPWTWLALVFSILGTLSIIFFYRTKKEWKEIQG